MKNVRFLSKNEILVLLGIALMGIILICLVI